MKKRIYSAVFLAACLACSPLQAQLKAYTPADAHSHNDYLNSIPFYRAYQRGFGSIEADVFPLKGDLSVAHDKDKITKERTLSSLYLKPAQEALSKDKTRRIRLLIDIKENHKEALAILVKQLEPMKQLLATPSKEGQLTIIISGNRPQPSNFKNYPDYIFFDDSRQAKHTPEQWKRVGLVSTDFSKITKWNGKGVLTQEDLAKVKNVVDSTHAAGKPLRFWATPDSKSAWIALMKLGVDVIGTDKVEELGAFLEAKRNNEYHAPEPYAVYKPTYRTDGKPGKVKNILLLIGDGMGLPHAYATYTVNRGQLNLFQFQSIGLSITTAADAYGTDSAAGATAMATGEKTNNRAVGVDTAGKPLKSLVSHAAEAGMKTAVVAASDLTDATPAAFYAHQKERSESIAIAHDLAAVQTDIDILVGAGRKSFEAKSGGSSAVDKLQAKGYTVVEQMDAFVASDASKLVALVPDSVIRPVMDGRGEFLSSAFKKVRTAFASHPKGFFLMLEGSQIDSGGHSNNMAQLITENADFDKVVGEALRFADENGETLVLVTADHETGGLTLLDGNISEGYVIGEFSTDDHTGIPVPVYAYGPHSNDFRGVYQNTEIFNKLLSLIKQYKK